MTSEFEAQNQKPWFISIWFSFTLAGDTLLLSVFFYWAFWSRFMRCGKVLLERVRIDKPITAKPAETRMGSGKGAVDHYVAVIKPGRIIFEIGGVSEEVAKEAVRLASHKLPVKTRFLTRGEAESVEG